MTDDDIRQASLDHALHVLHVLHTTHTEGTPEMTATPADAFAELIAGHTNSPGQPPTPAEDDQPRRPRPDLSQGRPRPLADGEDAATAFTRILRGTRF